MSEFKGTKGKWEIEYLASDESIRAVINDGIIDVWAIRTSIEEANANTLLISKAPEMLEFLTQLQYACENGLIQDLEELGESTKELIKSATEL